MARASLDFSYEEVVVLCRRLGFDVPVEEPGHPLDDVDTEVLDLLLGVAERGLLARRLIGAADEVHPAIADALSVVSAPDVIVDLVRHDHPSAAFTYASDPAMTVEHQRRPGGIHRLTVADTSELLELLRERTGLPAPTSATQFDVVGELTGLAWSHSTKHDAAAAIEVLHQAAIADETAQRIVAALRDGRASGSLTVLHRPTETTFEGGDISWLHLEDDLVAVVPGPEPTARPVDLAICTIRGLLAEIWSYLPGANELPEV